MTRLSCPGIVFGLIAAQSIAAYGDQVFFAREFLYTNEFKMGRDVFPEGFSMALSPRGIYIAGTFHLPSATTMTGGFPEPEGFIRGYTVAGHDRWTRQVAEPSAPFVSRMAADGASLYVAGTLGFGHTDLFLRKYDEAGNESWVRRTRISEGGYHIATGLAVDATGIYLAGRAAPSRGILQKYSLSGDELWSRTMSTFHIGDVAVDASGVYVAGWSTDTTGFVRKYTPGGEELWTREIDAGKICVCRT